MRPTLLMALMLMGCTAGTLEIDERDLDGDGIPDTEDTDADGDGIPDDEDADPTDPNTGDTGGTNGNTDDDGDGFSELAGDCNDNNPSINPAATDLVGDEVDQNCDNVDGVDDDGDGYASELSGGTDCDDGDIDINPAEDEVWYDGIDSDCGYDDDFDQDADGFVLADDCDDEDSAMYPGASEIFDGEDQDCEDDFDGFWFGLMDNGTSVYVEGGGEVTDASGYQFGITDGSNFDEDCLTGLCHTVNGNATITYGNISADGTTVFVDVGTWNSSLTFVVRSVSTGVCYTWGADVLPYVLDGCIEYDVSANAF